MNYCRLLIVFFLITVQSNLQAQTLAVERSVDWTLAGLRDTTTEGFSKIDLQLRGIHADGLTPNDSVLSAVVAGMNGAGAILIFPSGNFLFNQTLTLPNNIILKGQGANQTTLTLDMGGRGNGIRIEGNVSQRDTTSFRQFAAKNNRFIIVSEPSNFSTGDWIKLILDDSDLVTSTWARNSVGQLVSIEEVSNDTLWLASPLRLDYDMARAPRIQKIFPVRNVGIECLKIFRVDDTSPQQSSNIRFRNAVNCWVKGIDSHNCTYSHIYASSCSNIYISNSYIHHAFNFGSGGRAYGVMLDFSTNECLIENNIFERLRHAMILQAGANGNVFSYNYSIDPFWTSFINNAAGDMVLHGNYPYSNLFEQNICQNIVVDNSHGPNGPYNTIFRNKAESFGIFFSARNSPNQNIIGNEIPNTGFPYRLFNYVIRGDNHFRYGNNNKGRIDPVGTELLMDSSYAYANRPHFISPDQWARIGTPQRLNTASIPAQDRYLSGSLVNVPCENLITSYEPNVALNQQVQLRIFPNPFQSNISIKSRDKIKHITIINSMGQLVYSQKNLGFHYRIPTMDWIPDVYHLSITFMDNQTQNSILLKTRSY